MLLFLPAWLLSACLFSPLLLLLLLNHNSTTPGATIITVVHAGDPAGGKQPGSRSQKLELGKGHMASSASAEPTATFLNRLSSGKARFTRRIITLGAQRSAVTVET